MTDFGDDPDGPGGDAAPDDPDDPDDPDGEDDRPSTAADRPTTAEALVDLLEELGVERAFGYPGGRVIELLEHILDSSVEFVRPRDEREASVMAEVHGR